MIKLQRVDRKVCLNLNSWANQNRHLSLRATDVTPLLVMAYVTLSEFCGANIFEGFAAMSAPRERQSWSIDDSNKIVF